MAKLRTDLHQKIVDILGSGSVYYQPPATIKLRYPCIIYELESPEPKRADDTIFIYDKSYSVTLIYEDPDSTLVDAFEHSFEYIRHNRHYTADNLNHDVFTVYW